MLKHSKLTLKRRMWRLGAKLGDKVWLQKPSLQFHLARFGIKHPWKGAERDVNLSFEGQRIRLRCRDEATDVAVIAEIFAEEQYGWVRRLAGIRRVLDIGANIGTFSLFTHALHSAATFDCIEPDPANLQVLRQNLTRNSLNARVYEGAAVGVQPPGLLSLHLSRSRSSHSLCCDPTSTGSIVVEPVILGDLISSGPEVDLLKCDIEGAEESLFEDTDPVLLKQVRNFVIEYHSVKIRKTLGHLFELHFSVQLDCPINREQGVLCLERRDEPR